MDSSGPGAISTSALFFTICGSGVCIIVVDLCHVSFLYLFRIALLCHAKFPRRFFVLYIYGPWTVERMRKNNFSASARCVRRRYYKVLK